MTARFRSVFFAASIFTTGFASASRARADAPVTDEARSHFQAGVALLKDPDAPHYEDAYREFKEAYAISPSYKILGNLGLCAMKLERDEEAIDAYKRYLKEAVDIDPAERAQIESDLKTLEAGVVRVAIQSDPTGAAIEDSRIPVRGERVINMYGPTTASVLKIGIHPGHHEIRARLDGRPDAIWQVEANTGALDHTFTFEATAMADTRAAREPRAPIPVFTRPTPTSVYIGAGVTGALAIGTAVFGVLALGKKSDFNSKNDGSDPAAAASLRSSGQTLNTVTDLLLLGTVITAGVTTYLFIDRPSIEAPPKPAAAKNKTSLAPIWLTGGGGIVARTTW